jgi:uncharacterized protein YheU (UPF0270 family)
MEPTIQHKLTNIEIEPPHGLWELLSVRLDAEYEPSEIRLAQRMNDAVLIPPTDSWAAIEANLPVRSLEESIPLQRKEPAKLFSIPVRKIAVALVALIVISFAGWLFFPPTAEGPQVGQDKVPQANTLTTPPTVPSGSGNTRSMPPAIAQQVPSIQRPLPVNAGRNSNNENEKDKNTETIAGNTDSNQPDLPATNPSIVQPQDVVTEVNIPARPYRDATGKMVMDMNLLTTPGTQYVTVTAPNGEQTRISRKFLPVLTFLNTGADNGQFNAALKQKIQELRKELLQQASFVPSAANFLDIMELKELLQDK